MPHRVREVHPTSDAERARLYAFVCETHVEASSYSAASRECQVNDCPTDFPELYSAGKWRQLASPCGWVAEDDSGLLIGACGLKPCASRDRCVDISYLFVAPAARGHGLGRLLLRTALDHVRRLQPRPYDAIRLLTLADVYAPAIALYVSEGFREYKAREDTPEGYYSLVYMELVLADVSEGVGPMTTPPVATSKALSPLPPPPPPVLSPRQRVVEARVRLLAFAFFALFAAFSTSQLLQSSINASVGITCLLSMYTAFAISALCAPALMASAGASRLSLVLAASAAPYAAMTAANLVPSPALLLISCVGVGCGAGTLWAGQGVFMGLASAAYSAAAVEDGATSSEAAIAMSLSATRLNAAFYSIFMASGGVSNTIATLLMLALPDPALAVQVLFVFLSIIAMGGVFILSSLERPDAEGVLLLVSGGLMGCQRGGTASKQQSVAGQSPAEADAAAAIAWGVFDSTSSSGVGDSSQAAFAGGVEEGGEQRMSAVLVSAPPMGAAATVATASPAPSPLYMIRFLLSERRVWCLAPVSFTTGAVQGFLLGAYMASVVAKGVGATWVGFAGASFSIASALAVRVWSKVAQKPTFGRRGAFLYATIVQCVWFVIVGSMWRSGGWEGATTPHFLGDAAIAPVIFSVALYAMLDPVWQAFVLATLQSFYPKQPQLACAMAAPRFFYSAGFASMQVFTLIARQLADGKPCITEHCVVCLTLTLIAGASLTYLHKRIAPIDAQ